MQNKTHYGYARRGEFCLTLKISGLHNENRAEIVNKKYAKMLTTEAVICFMQPIRNFSEFEFEMPDIGLCEFEFDGKKYELNQTIENIHYYLTTELIQNEYFVEQPNKTGQYCKWNDEGDLILKCSYKHGELHGLLEQNFVNGKPLEVINYHNGNLHGHVKLWHSNGNLRYFAFYENDILDGPCIHYNECGNIQKISHFRNGVLHNESIEFDNDECERKRYNNGIKCGDTINYFCSFDDIILLREYNQSDKDVNTCVLEPLTKKAKHNNLN